MAIPKDGGPAFPHGGNNEEMSVDGMTLLDWFAGQILAGMLANSYNDMVVHDMIQCTQEAYDTADLMLKIKLQQR